MLGVLLGSLAAAYGLTTQRQGRPSVGLMRVERHDLSFTLPKNWREVESTPSQASSELVPLRYIDTTRPTRTLMLMRIQTADPMPGQVVLPQVLEDLMRQNGVESVQSLDREVWQRGDLLVSQWVGATPTTRTVHVAANLTRNGRIHWLLYLTDQVSEGEGPEAVLRQSLALLQSIIHSAALAPPDPGPDEPAAAPPGTAPTDEPTHDPRTR